MHASRIVEDKRGGIEEGIWGDILFKEHVDMELEAYSIQGGCRKWIERQSTFLRVQFHDIMSRISITS